MRRAPWFIFSLLLAMSCLDSPDCFQLNNNLVGIAFRIIGSDKLDTLKSRIDISGANAYFTDTATIVYVPLNFTENTSDILFKRTNAENDTLVVSYRTQLQYVSEDCGSRQVLSNLIIGDHSFDSVRLINNTPSKSGAVNIEVFRCPDYRFVGINLSQRYITTSTNNNRTKSHQARLTRFKKITNDFNSEVLYSGSGRSTIYLPLNTEKNQTTYTFSFADDFADHFSPDSTATLTLNYVVNNSDPIYLNACGVLTTISQISVAEPTTFSFDSLMFSNAKKPLDYVQDPAIANVDLGRCPQLNLMQLSFKRYNASRTAKSSASARIRGISTDYSDKIYYGVSTDTTIVKSIVNLPLNPNATTTTFTIEYTQPGKAKDVITVSYTLGTTVEFIECGEQATFTKLTEAVASDKLELLENSLDIKFPAVPNADIILN